MKIIKRILFFILSLIIIIFVFIYVNLRISLPKTEGFVRVKGIDSEVTVKRNQWGVPLIQGKSARDVFFAIGYVQASDRLFQMDLVRRYATGRLSEIFGKVTLDSDIYQKSLLIEEIVERSAQDVDPKIRELLQSYCNGVNYYIKNGNLAPEFKVLRYKPEAWRIRDIFSIFKNMEVMLASSGSELYNERLVKALGKEKAKEFMSGVYGKTIISHEEYNNLFQNKSLQMSLSKEMDLMENLVGSNNWVISGKKTASGFPLLANDPHLAAVFPSHFYQIVAKAGDLELSGNTLPGVPFIIIGRTKEIGWGFTNIGTDVIDYFILEINPQDENQYLLDGLWVNFKVVEKKIKVKDCKEPHVLKVKVSTFGPLQEENGKSYAMHSIVQSRSTVLEAFYKMNFSRDLEGFIEGLKKFSSPAQNIVFADTKGNIGYYPAGLIPIRSNGDGSLPIKAVSSNDSWKGFYKEKFKPFLLNPEKGYVVTANNPVIPDTLIPMFARTWNPYFRAERIDELIQPEHSIDVEFIKKVQTDSYLKGAEFLIGSIKDFQFKTEGTKFVFNHLMNWDLRANAGISPFLFYKFEYHLLKNIFQDDIKDEKYKGLVATSWLYKIMNYPEADTQSKDFLSWIDNKNTSQKENFKEIVGRSLADTFQDYSKESKNQKLEWQKIHTLYYKHPMGFSVLKTLLNRGPFGMEGGKGCILTASFKGRNSFQVNHTSTFRMIMDFSKFSNSLFINSSGQSGHFLSKNYEDQIPLYINLEYREMEEFHTNLRELTLKPGI
jgi:penicillin amidase